MILDGQLVTDRSDGSVTTNDRWRGQTMTDRGGKTAGLTDGDRFFGDDGQTRLVTGDRFSQFDRPIRARTHAGAVEQKVLSHPSPSTLTDRVRQHLIATGRITENGTSRRLQIRSCHQCRTTVLAALDADICAFDIQADPDPVGRLGELLAVADGRRSYDVIDTAGRLELEYRRAIHIGSRRRCPVVVEHRCAVVVEHRCGLPVPAEPVAAIPSIEEAVCPF